MRHNNRYRQNDFSQNLGKSGVVYILENEGLRHGYYKIGCSTRSGYERAKDLNKDANTGTPGMFVCIFEHKSNDCGKAEQRVFIELHKHRKGKWGQEFFEIDLNIAKQTIIRICKEVDSEIEHPPSPPRRPPDPRPIPSSPTEESTKKNKNKWHMPLIVFAILILIIFKNDPGSSSNKLTNTPENQPTWPSNPLNYHSKQILNLDESDIEKIDEIPVIDIETNVGSLVEDEKPSEIYIHSQENLEDWLNEMSTKLQEEIPRETDRRDFLLILHYEANRAGLDPQLILSLIDVLSRFNANTNLHEDNAGYMQVNKKWLDSTQHPNFNLMRTKTNLRYGTSILRGYLDVQDSELHRSLTSYLRGNNIVTINVYEADDLANEILDRLKSKWHYIKPET